MRYKTEQGGDRPDVGEYYHVISSMDSGNEEPAAPADMQAEELPENGGAFQLFSVLVNSGAVECHSYEVGTCNGSSPGNTLQWLCSIDQIPETFQKTVAEFTVCGSVLVQCNKKKYRWSETQIEMAHVYVSADFCRVQRDRLRELAQRSGETIGSYLETYETLLNEAYARVPDDQSELIRDLLSGLKDEAMACCIAACGHATIRATVKDILIQSHWRDYLRKQVKHKVAVIIPTGEAALGKAIEELNPC